MTKRVVKHDFIIGLFTQVDSYLSGDSPDVKLLPSSLINFCIVTEKVLKMHLYKKNKTLAYDISKFKDTDQLVAVALGKAKDCLVTIQYEEVIQRFKMIHKRIFSDEEVEILRDLYRLRNCFVHSHKSDSDIDFVSEDIVKRMGTLWPKISKLAIKVLGKVNIKSTSPKKTYSEEELRAVLIEEVRKKINQPTQSSTEAVTFGDLLNRQPVFTATGLMCPRCGSEKFGQETDSFVAWNRDNIMWSSEGSQKTFMSLRSPISDIYKCQKCNLELTEKEYELYRLNILENGSWK